MDDSYRGADNPNNPHEQRLGVFLRGRESPVNANTRHRFGVGYAGLRTGQIVRSDTLAALLEDR